MTNQSDDETDQVGYGKPPTKNRFKKGESGNPGGRPKKQLFDFDKLIIAKLEAPLPQSNQTRLDAMLNGGIKTAAQGDIKALRLLLELYLSAKKRQRMTMTDDEEDKAVVDRILNADPRILADLLAPENDESTCGPVQIASEPIKSE